MILKYPSGEEIRKGDRVLFHREPGHFEVVAVQMGDPETVWFTQEYGGGVMILDGVAGRTFIPADQIDECDHLEFVSRAEASKVLGGLLAAEEVDEEFGDAGGLFVLEPVGRVGEGEEFGVGAVAQAGLGHFFEQEGVALTPENTGGDVHGAVRDLRPVAEGRAIPVDHGGEGAGLRPRGAILREVFFGESAGAAGARES